MKQITLLFAIILNLQSIAQIQAGGTVLSAIDKLPVQDVTVIVKNGTYSTTTNSKGLFSITADSSSILVFTHIGYSPQEVKWNGTNRLVIFLQPSSALLSEVTVSTGYQDIPKERTAGSFGKINNTALDRVVNTNIIAKLEGLTPGLYFSKANKKTELAVRGLSTLNAATEPLIILDNFPYEGSLADINPNDVESVTLLKDASAASIWGAKAGNGVIVITTKKSAFNSQPRVTINSNITLQQKPDLFYSPAFLNTNDFIDLEKSLFSKGFYNSALNNTTSRPIISPVVEILARQRAGAISSADADALINSFRAYDIRNDVSRYLYQQGVKQQYALNLSGGSSFVNYLFNLGWDKTRPNAVGDEQQRKTLSTSFNIKPFSKLEIGASLLYTLNNAKNNSITDLAPGGGRTAIYPYARLADERGNPLTLEKSYRSAYLDTAGAGLLLDWKYRPLDELKLKDLSSSSGHIVTRLSLKYTFNSALSAEVKYGLEKSGFEQHNYNPVESFSARSLINLYSQRIGTSLKRNIPYGGYLDQRWETLSSWSLRGQLNYVASWKRHRLSAIAGSEIREANTTAQTGRTYGYDDNMTNWANVDYLTVFTQWGNLGSNTIPSNISFAGMENRFVSLYFNASYTYHSRYTITASARKDASNIFGVNTNQKWQPLWSVGGAWNLSSESFYHFRLVPVLKLRTSFGYSGNVLPMSALPTISYDGPHFITNLPTAGMRNPPNPDLRWEKVGTFNGGLDFEFNNNVLRGSIDYYNKKSVDLLGTTAVDPTVGFPNMLKNTASLRGKGIDVNLEGKIGFKQFWWNPQLIFSYVTNKVTKYVSNLNSPSSMITNGYIINPVQGQQPYTLASYKWAGLDPATGEPMGYYSGAISKDYSSITSKATISDIAFSGTTRPPYFGNFINSFSLQGFTLTANISYKFHYWFRRDLLSYSALFNQWRGNRDYEKRWQKPGDEAITNVPALMYPANNSRDQFYTLSEVSIEKGDMIKLQDISLSYTLNKLRIGKAVVKTSQFYIYAANGPILWRANKQNLDPDYGTSTPPPLSISLGLKTTF